MRYVDSRYWKQQRELAYRIYVTDSLYYSAHQKMLSERYIDMVSDETPSDNRSGEEIVADVVSRLGLKADEFI